MITKTIHRLKSHLALALAFTLGLLFLYPTPVYAMHIAEGILPASWAAAWSVIAFVFVVLGIRFIKRRTKEVRGLMPLLGLTGAAIFLISLISVPVPIAGTCSHPSGTPLGAILVGPFIGTILGAVALLLQALFFGHGGITTWGANIVSMGVVGSFVGFGVFMLLRKSKAPIAVAAFGGGLLGQWAIYVTTAFQMALALHAPGLFWNMFGAILAGFAPGLLPLGILEGVFTAAVVVFLYRRRPELLTLVIPKGFSAAPKTAKVDSE